MDDFVIECPSLAGQRNVIISSVGQWIVGAIENNDMRNILENPLSYNLGALDHDTNIKKAWSIGIKGKKCPSFMSSPSSVSISSSQNLDREIEPQGNHGYRSEAMHKRLVSVSSSNSTCSDQSSPSACDTISQGMLHCTWKSGVPYFVFSVEDQREVYVANMWVVESSDDKSLDYMYTFHSRTDGPKEQVTCSVSDLVGKMKVSSSFSICSNNSKLIETEFVLFGANENHFREMQISTPPRKRNNKFPKRVVDVLGTNHPSRDRSSTKFGVPSSILEDFAWEPCQDMFNKLNASSRANLLQNHLLSNLELAAIVVRGYTEDDCEEATVGGWGLKFLKKNGSQQINTSVEASVSSECCPDSFLQKKTNCSSMHVLLPAGIHGGPWTRNGGPSSLSERWRSGGDCDCGGWDIGCPLTVLNSRTSMEEVSQGSAQGECKSLNLFMQVRNNSFKLQKSTN
uniref:Uncharacterized protein n=1 Tax=Nelumbo nucifera TaxID=4432 RepID=A0A822XX68_NELNU|nr:TPA_asm: hypothetical protein HUJ06_024828 [Nelumbo nucifera]